MIGIYHLTFILIKIMLELEPVPFLDSGLDGFLTPHAVQIHVTKHHQAYIDNGNKLLKGSPYEGKKIEEIIQQSDGGIFNNVSQHYNHAFFWKCLTNEKQTLPENVEKVFESIFGSFANFKDEFVSKAMTNFGSGWVYLYKKADGEIEIGQYSNAGSPIKTFGFPLLCIDTWEHAWYIDYENRKAEYFNKFWDHVNWNFVEKRMIEAKLI